MTRWVALACAAMVLSMATIARAGPASEIVQRRQEAVFAAARSQPSASRQQRVQQALFAMFDYDEMVRRIESRRWRALPPAKQRELRAAVRSFLVHSHEVLVATHREHDLIVRIVSEQKRSNLTIVVAEVTPRDAKDALPERITYTLRGSRVVDLHVPWLWETAVFRSQVDRAIRRSKVDDVVAKLEARALETPRSLPTVTFEKRSARVSLPARIAAVAALGAMLLLEAPKLHRP